LVTPQWLKPTPARLGLAEDILAAFAENYDHSRRQFEEAVQVVVQRAGSVPIAKGLVKLLDDACEWTEPGSRATQRMDLLQRAAQHLGRYSSLQEYRNAVAHDAVTADAVAVSAVTTGAATAQAEDQDVSAPTPDELSDAVYADLPSRACLQKVPDWSPRYLLQAYNTALVQGLVLAADEVVITLQDTPHAPLQQSCRTLLRAASFHRLLAEGRHDGEGIEIVCSGPARVLEQQQAYGSQLALLMPTVLGLAGGWTLRASLRDQRRDLHGDMLVEPHDAEFLPRSGAFIPPEISQAGEQLAVKLGPGWQVHPGVPVSLPSGRLIAPDWECTGPAGEQLQVEVFHRWHAGMLRQRLQSVEELPGGCWLFAVDRGLLKKSEHADLKEHPTMHSNGLLFSGMPTANKLAQAAHRALKKEA
jgi:predicted nuclease of restriction endonuclease-like RecB superfamily